jgi:hypothetical protein
MEMDVSHLPWPGDGPCPRDVARPKAPSASRILILVSGSAAFVVRLIIT